MLSCRTIPAIGSASVIPNPFSSQILTNEVANSLCGAPRAFPGASHPGDAPAKFRTALAVRRFRPPRPMSSGCAAQTTCCSGLNGRRSERASADRLWSRCGLRAARPLVFAWARTPGRRRWGGVRPVRGSAGRSAPQAPLSLRTGPPLPPAAAILLMDGSGTSLLRGQIGFHTIRHCNHFRHRHNIHCSIDEKRDPAAVGTKRRLFRRIPILVSNTDCRQTLVSGDRIN